MAITINGISGVGPDTVQTLTNKTLESPVINNATFTGAQAGLEIKFGNNIVLEGTTADAFEMTLSGGDPTADRTVTLPDATGTVALTSDITVTASSTNTFSNKTISASSNTLTGVVLDTLTTTTGDMIYASSNNTPARLAVGADGRVLTVASGVPSWQPAAEVLSPFNHSFLTMGA